MNPEQQEFMNIDEKQLEIDKYNDIKGASDSLILTMNRLKQSQDRLYFAKQRLDILHSKQCQAFNKSMDNQRKSSFFQQISQFAHQQKVRKYKNQSFRQSQLQQMRRKNSQHRSQYKDKRKQYRQNFILRNNQINLQVNRQRKLNQKKVKQFQSNQYLRKKNIRDNLYNGIKQGNELVKQCKNNRRLNSILSRQQDRYSALCRIQQNELHIKSLKQQSQQANQQLNQLIEQSRYKPYLQSPNNNSKGFRVKYKSKNQTTVLMQQ